MMMMTVVKVKEKVHLVRTDKALARVEKMDHESTVRDALEKMVTERVVDMMTTTMIVT